MPAIPVYRQQTRATGSLGAAPNSSAGETGSMLGALVDVARKIDITHKANQLTAVTAKTLGELEAYKGELEADDDFDSHADKYLAKAQEIQERTTKELRGSTIASLWKQDFDRAARTSAVQVQIRAQTLKANKARADLGNNLFDLSQLTGTDPQTDEMLRAQAKVAVGASAAAGNLSFSERNELLNKFETDSSEAAIRRDMLSDPEVAEQKLASGAYPHLSGEVQAIWAQRVSAAAESRQRRALAEEDREVRLSDKARKEAGDAATKQGDSLLSAGRLTQDWIEAHRNVLDPNDFRYFYRAMNGSGDAPRNPGVYVDLREKAGRGLDMRTDAREALQHGQIGVSDYDRIVSEVESSHPGWYKRGSQYISTMSGVSDLNPDPAGAQTKATMLDQWSDWAEGHQKASDVEAQRAYQDIVSHNMLVQMAGLPLPKLLVGSRLTPNLDATEAATVKAYQTGEIYKGEFERQAVLLKQWRAATQATETKKPTP